jgi:hypothetical protein
MEKGERQLTGLELRKACCEALGWHHGDRFWHHPWCGKENGCMTGCGVRLANIAGLPAIESDIGVACSALRDYCKKRNYGWRIKETDLLRVFIFRRGMITRNQNLTIITFQRGDDIAEAIARAIVKAEEKHGTKS